MPRNLSAEMLAELRSNLWRPVIFFYGQFNSGPQYLWSGIGTKNWNGHDWLGVGHLGKVNFPQESGEAQADNFSVELSGIPSQLLGLALTESKQGNPVEVWLGARSDTGAIIADPTLAAAGRLDVPSIEEGSVTSTIKITCESLLVDFKTPRSGRFTDEDQQLRFPGDRFCAFVGSIQDWNRKWTWILIPSLISLYMLSRATIC